jgi:hypothetical protein
LEAGKLSAFKRNIGGWSTSLRNHAGEIIEYGMSHMRLFMIANMVNNAVYSTMALMKDMVSLAFGQVHRLTGVALTAIKDKWIHWTTHQEVSMGDAANRCAGAETTEDLRQLSPAHYLEVGDFINACNSRAGPGKVTKSRKARRCWRIRALSKNFTQWHVRCTCILVMEWKEKTRGFPTPCQASSENIIQGRLSPR